MSVARELGVLGATVVRDASGVVVLRPRERDVLAAIAVASPNPIGTVAIVDLLWPREAPPTAKVSVQNHIARLRRALGDDAVHTEAGAYRLGPSWTLDVDQFDADVARARRGALEGDHGVAQVFLRRALALVRGDAFADLADSALVVGERLRRRQLRLAAEDELVLALVGANELAAAIADASSLVAAEPYREARWMALALALYRSGDRRESVLVLQRGREAIREVSGLDGGPGIAHLESLLLHDDPSLLLADPAPLLSPEHAAVAARSHPEEILVGRDAPLAEVRQLLLRAFDERRGLTVEIVGDAGIGKSALARRVALQAAIDGWHVVTGICRAGRSRALEPLGDLVRQVLQLEPNPADAFEPGLLADLATLWSPSPAGPARGDVGEATVTALGDHAGRHPTLLVVDDAHHLSPTADQLLQRIGALPAPAVVLRLRRPGRPACAGAVPIELGGLALDETTRLLELVTGEVVTSELAAAVHATTHGYPALVPEAAGIAGQVFLTALDQLTGEARDLAAVLAVAGGPLDSHVARAVAPAAGARQVASGVAVGVFRVDSDARIDLTNSALRDALVVALDPDGRAALHARIGSALAAAGNVLAAAPHLLVAGDDPHHTIAVAEAAATVATQATMYVEAAALLHDAAALATLTLGGSHHRTLTLLLARAENLRRAGDATSVELAWEVVRRAEAAGDGDALALGAAALCMLGPLTESGTLNVAVADTVERALSRCTDPALRARCAGEATLFYSMSGRVDRCRSLFQDALDHARLTGDDRVLLGVLGNIYPSLTHPEDWTLRAELAAEMLMLAERLDHQDARFQALHVYFSTQVQFADPLLRTTFARQEEVAATLRTAGRRWMVGYQRACIAYLDGRLDEAAALSSEITERAPVDSSRAWASHLMLLLPVRLAEGREQELAAEIDQLVEQQPGMPGFRSTAAWLAARRGDHDRVRRECNVLDDGAAMPHDMVWSGAAMLLGRAVATLDDADRSARLTALLEPYSGLVTWIGSCTVGPFDIALAELALVRGEHDTARRHLEAAQRAVHRLGAVVYQPDLDRLAARVRRVGSDPARSATEAP